MLHDSIEVKPGTRSHRGFFVQEASYKLMDIHSSGWALICLNDAACYYVDPDDLEMTIEIRLEEV